MRKRGATFRRIDRNELRLAACPWKVDAAWQPLESVLARLEIDGTVETAQGRPVLHDDMTRGWYETAPAIDGLADWHEIAAQRHGWPCDVGPLRRLAAKLRNGSPVFAGDLRAVREAADVLKRQALRLTVAEAMDVLQTIRIGVAMAVSA